MNNVRATWKTLAWALLGACSNHSQTATPTDAGVFSLPETGSSCLGSSTPAPSSDAADPLCTPDLPEVRYTNDVVPILSQCSGEVCHAPWNVENTVGKHSTACCDERLLIAPGQPSQSHIIQAVRGDGACVPKMPLESGALPPASVTVLIAWVCQGATKN